MMACPRCGKSTKLYSSFQQTLNIPDQVPYEVEVRLTLGGRPEQLCYSCFVSVVEYCKGQFLREAMGVAPFPG